MQTPLVKRSMFSILDSSREESPAHFQEPRKKLKSSLRIEISDPFSEKSESPINSTSASKAKSFYFGPKPLQTCKVSTSTPPRLDTSYKGKFDFSKFLKENDAKYDDLNRDEEIYNLTMRKGHRKTMEDRATTEKLDDNSIFFAVYDGHTHSYTADYLHKNLHKTIYNHPDFYSNPKQAIKESIYTMDQEVCRNLEKLNLQGGSTALLSIIIQNKLFLANVGDSKAILIREDQAIPINTEHVASNEEERKTVEARGGFVFEKKGSAGVRRSLVQGSLEVTRAIGDRSYKKYISCEPDIYEYEFTQNDQYLILASDGLWKEMSEEEVLSHIKMHPSSQGLSLHLVEEVLKKKNYSIDNVSVIVIDLRKLCSARTS